MSAMDAIGTCCYGGRTTRSQCGSCMHWKPADGPDWRAIANRLNAAYTKYIERQNMIMQGTANLSELSELAKECDAATQEWRDAEAKVRG